MDRLDAERFGPLGSKPLVTLDLADTDTARRAAELAAQTHAIVVGFDRYGALPAVIADDFDLLLTTASGAPCPWVDVSPSHLEERIDAISRTVTTAPMASATAARVLRIQESLRFDDALLVESLAYSALLGGSEFRHWRMNTPRGDLPAAQGDPVSLERQEDRVTITLGSPTTRNGMSAAMRDGLYAALAATLDDPTEPTVELAGAGPCFCTGGMLDEFGSANDLALAHAIRILRSCARLLHDLGDRACAHLHGASIGSGIEIPAAAARRIASPNAFFQLPELAMGLIPGAGGTVTIPRAIGRHRTAYMLFSTRRINARTALHWGLVHEIVG